MEDRVTFMKSISCTNFQREVQVYFDHMAALYNILGTRTDADIFTELGDDELILFNILIDDEIDPDEYVECFNSKEITMYENRFRVEVQVHKDVLKILLSKI